MEAQIEKRGPGRPPMSKDESVDVKGMSPRDLAAAERARAEERIRSLRENGWDASESQSGHDEFAIDLDLIDPHWSVEWKTEAVTGMDMQSHLLSLWRAGWEPVPTSRWPAMMPVGTKGSEPIRRKGLILCERPKELTDEARYVQERSARLQVKNKEESLNAAPAGQFERNNKDTPLAKVKRSFEAMPIPE